MQESGERLVWQMDDERSAESRRELTEALLALQDDKQVTMTITTTAKAVRNAIRMVWVQEASWDNSPEWEGSILLRVTSAYPSGEVGVLSEYDDLYVRMPDGRYAPDGRAERTPRSAFSLQQTAHRIVVLYDQRGNFVNRLVKDPAGALDQAKESGDDE